MYLLVVGSHYCVMRFAYALHMRQQNLVLFPCLCIELFELVIEIILHYCITPPCHKIDLFKRPFRGSRSERLDDASVLIVSLILMMIAFITIKRSLVPLNEGLCAQIYFRFEILYPQKILISVR